MIKLYCIKCKEHYGWSDRPDYSSHCFSCVQKGHDYSIIRKQEVIDNLKKSYVTKTELEQAKKKLEKVNKMKEKAIYNNEYCDHCGLEIEHCECHDIR